MLVTPVSKHWVPNAIKGEEKCAAYSGFIGMKSGLFTTAAIISPMTRFMVTAYAKLCIPLHNALFIQLIRITIYR